MSTNDTQKEKRAASSNIVPILVAIIGALATIIVTLLTIFKEPILDRFNSPDLKALAIEEIPQNIFVFAGNNSPDGGWGAFSLVYDDKHILNYRMEYSLPEDKYGYAGMVFQFPEGHNLSAYKAVEFTIALKVPTDAIDLFIKDISNNNNKIHIAGNGQNEMVLSYEFTNFPEINFNAVKEVGVIASTDFSKGDHQVRIKSVRFVK